MPTWNQLDSYRWNALENKTWHQLDGITAFKKHKFIMGDDNMNGFEIGKVLTVSLEANVAQDIDTQGSNILLQNCSDNTIYFLEKDSNAAAISLTNGVPVTENSVYPILINSFTLSLLCDAAATVKILFRR
jgi:hypothetical protein